MRGSVCSLLVAMCAVFTAFASVSIAATASPESRFTSAPALPIVINTWPFVNATRVAFRTLTQEHDASAIDAVEKVRQLLHARTGSVHALAVTRFHRAAANANTSVVTGV
jgi:hypothetical protein